MTAPECSACLAIGGYCGDSCNGAWGWYTGDRRPVFAAFVIAPAGDDAIAATTRAADRGETGRIGLPGGKLDSGESPINAARREAAEEGWFISGEFHLVHEAEVDGRPVQWFASRSPAVWLRDHAEAGRVEPVAVATALIADSGYGNRAAMAAYLAWRGVTL